jgi:hypothetical protein
VRCGKPDKRSIVEEFEKGVLFQRGLFWGERRKGMAIL